MSAHAISKTGKRATLYLKPDLHKTLKFKSIESSRTMSEIVNDALQDSFLEDLDDLKVIEERKNEKPISYEEMLKRLKLNA